MDLYTSSLGTLVSVFYAKMSHVYWGLLIRCNKTKFFLWSTNNTDRNGVNKQNPKKHSE